MHRRIQACTDELLATLTEGVVLGVNRAVTWLSVGAIQRHKASGGTCHCNTRLHTNLEW